MRIPPGSLKVHGDRPPLSYSLSHNVVCAETGHQNIGDEGQPVWKTWNLTTGVHIAQVFDKVSTALDSIVSCHEGS